MYYCRPEQSMILILWLQCDWMLEALEEVDEEQLSEEEEQQSWDQEGSPFPSLLQNPGMDELQFVSFLSGRVERSFLSSYFKNVKSFQGSYNRGELRTQCASMTEKRAF